MLSPFRIGEKKKASGHLTSQSNAKKKKEGKNKERKHPSNTIP
jgi:hypothetical protein